MVAIALHGPDAACHDHHAEPGAFARAIEALRAARGATVTTVLTRSNYRALAAMPALLHAHGAAAWHVVVAQFAEASADQPARAPRLALALPFALHALARAQQLGVAIAIVDAPRCLLGRFAPALTITAPRSFPAPCAACTARAQCGGVDAAYAARFGPGELAPAP